MSKIAIISESSTVLNSVQAKLVLLREDDSVVKSDTSSIFKTASSSDIILLHTPQINDITLTTISNIKTNNNVIILIVEEVNPKNLLEAYDIGVSDFCNLNITNFELLIKIINAKKALKQQKSIERLKTQLRDKGIINPTSNAYTQISDIVNANFYSEIINSSMLVISVEENSHQEFILNNIENLFSTILRESDFIINYSEFNYLIILPNTSLENCVKVYEKLKNKSHLDMKALIFHYQEESAKDLRNRIERLEYERDEKELTLYIDNNTEEPKETEEDWLSNDLSQDEGKAYKLFQNIFNKKIETVIEPVFYRTKQKYEKNFANTKIKYFTDKNRAEFMLVSFDKTNSLQIVYKNSAKVRINMQFSGLEAPEGESLEIPFSKLNTRTLTEVIENFIKKGEN